MGNVSTHKCVVVLAWEMVVGTHIRIRRGLQKAKIKFIAHLKMGKFITLSRSITMFCGTGDVPQNIIIYFPPPRAYEFKDGSYMKPSNYDVVKIKLSCALSKLPKFRDKKREYHKCQTTCYHRDRSQYQN